jgi:hypothetical protein
MRSILKYTYQYFATSEDDDRVHDFRNNIYTDISKSKNLLKIDFLPIFFRRGESVALFFYSFINSRILVLVNVKIFSLLISIFNIIKIPFYIFNKNWNWKIKNVNDCKKLYFGRTNENCFTDLLNQNTEILKFNNSRSYKIPSNKKIFRFLHLRFKYTSINNSRLIKYVSLEYEITKLFNQNKFDEVIVYEGFSVEQRLLIRLANKFNIKTSVALKNLYYRFNPYYPISKNLYLISSTSKDYICENSDVEIQVHKLKRSKFIANHKNPIEILYIPALTVYGLKKKRKKIINWLNSLNKQIKVNLNIRFHPQLNINDRKIIYDKFKSKTSEFVNIKIDNLSLDESLRQSSYVFSEYFSTVIEDASEQGIKTICFRTNNENLKFLNKNISSLIYFLNIDNNDSSNLNSIKFEDLSVEFQSLLKIKNAI